MKWRGKRDSVNEMEGGSEGGRDDGSERGSKGAREGLSVGGAPYSSIRTPQLSKLMVAFLWLQLLWFCGVHNRHRL